ncbi:MAG: hypothetical protein U7123_13370 [Potamolinea sp.]
MVTLVVIVNVIISLLCLYVAWQVWNLRLALAAATKAIKDAERNTHKTLSDAPNAISQGQLGVKGLRESYQQLEVQLQQVQRVVVLLGLVERIWRGQSRRVRRPQRNRKLR